MSDEAEARRTMAKTVLAPPPRALAPGRDVPLRTGRAPEGRRSGMGLATIIGNEDRARITETDAIPWRLVCSLTGLQGGRAVMVGTGALISPRLVLTAGHNLDDSIDEIEIAPGRSDGNRPYGSVRLGRDAFHQHPAWSNPDLRDPDRDAGALVLDAPFRGLEDEWFAIAAPDDDALGGWMLNIAGYPDESPTNRAADGAELWFHSNAVEAVAPHTIQYAIDTTFGQSGAPVWAQAEPDAPPTVVGIHAYGAPPRIPGLPLMAFNAATRIDDDLASHIRQWADL